MCKFKLLSYVTSSKVVRLETEALGDEGGGAVAETDGGVLRELEGRAVVRPSLEERGLGERPAGVLAVVAAHDGLELPRRGLRALLRRHPGAEVAVGSR